MPPCDYGDYLGADLNNGHTPVNFDGDLHRVVLLFTQREQFLLFAMDGYSYAEIGKMQGCSKEAARLSIDSVRKKFLKFFR